MNVRKTPKQREIELREELLLETAGKLLMSEGFAALSMERLAEELNTAKGTIYNHYPNREELILSMAVRAINKRQQMFEKASMCKGRPRARMTAFGVACEIYVRSYPLHFIVESSVRHASIWDRCSEERREFMRSKDQQCMGLAAGVVRSAIADGDLELTNGMKPEELTLSLWALTYGTHIINLSSPYLKEIGIDSIYRSIRMGTLHILNGVNWQPTWSATEHDDHVVQICESVFPDETPLPRSTS